ncbi:MAG: excinuclease ABC subunit UvrC [Caldilineaceae bacterium]
MQPQQRPVPERVQQRLDNLPDSPGCYLMKDSKGKVIYVGKAIVLRNRVRSYFHAAAQEHPKTAALVAEIRDISWWVTSNELEALILENELIKQYRPHYNIRLKDDKTFPYIKVNWKDDYPKVSVVRKIVRDGARYFGPYTSGRASYTTLDALRRIFPYLDCEREITGKDERPCLYYHIKLCGGPCIGAQNREEYRNTIQQLMDFLNGKADRVLTQLKKQMDRAAENLQFELAAAYRDRLKAAQQIAEQQKIVSTVAEDLDYIALALDERTGDTAVQVFLVRNGRLIGRENFLLEGVKSQKSEVKASEVETTDQNEATSTDVLTVQSTEDETTDSGLQTNVGALIGEFMQQFYAEATFVPKQIMVQAMPPDIEVLSEWLSKAAEGKVEVRVPQRGSKLTLMQLAMENAAEYLRLQQAEWASDTNRQTNAVSELQEALGLANPPSRIECYDISTLQGTNTVGSMVVFAKGAPLKSAYRRFKIRGKGSDGAPDDFASMREMLRRRFKRVVDPEAESEIENGNNGESGADNSNTNEKQNGAESNESWKILPDLIIIDGGKGQLGVAVEVLQEYGLLDRLPIVGLAKREEEIFFPGNSNPLWLKRGSQALHLVQRVRDEAHRFGVTFHRKLRSKGQTKSKLDDVPGVGPTRRKALMTYFGGDLDRIRRASVEELQAVPGINRKAAESIKATL